MNATSEGAARLTQFATRSHAGAAPGAGGQRELLAALAGRSAGERWQLLAETIVRDRLADVVPADLQHQQAARAELVNAMAHEGWNEPSADHAEAATESIQGAEAATTRIRAHYTVHTHPYPTAEPSRTPPNLPLATDSDRYASDADPARYASGADPAHYAPAGDPARVTSPADPSRSASAADPGRAASAADPGRAASAVDSDQALRAALSGQARPGATQPARGDSADSARHKPTATRDSLQRG